jgi:hypothetical protein
MEEEVAAQFKSIAVVERLDKPFAESQSAGVLKIA